MATLLQFTVGNFKSFHQTRTFSMIPNSIQDSPKDAVAAVGRNKFLTTAAIYGANSSGKSNLLEALATMSIMVEKSVRLNNTDSLLYQPFLLSTTTGQPTHFEIIYINNQGIRVRYGFEYTLKEIKKEWLFFSKRNKDEQAYYLRDEEGIGVNEDLFQEGVNLESKTNKNRLFLSLVAQLGGEISNGVLNFFKFGQNVISGLSSIGYSDFTKNQFFVNSDLASPTMDFFQKLQLGFSGIETSSQDVEIPSDAPDSIKMVLKGAKEIKVFSRHNIYDENGNFVDIKSFPFEKFESEGTKKIFELAGPVFDSLKDGKLLVVDELDAKMHPLLSQQIIKLFTDKRTNPHNAQLIFTTHDTNILSSHLLRRDQIWFTEKDQTESTDLYRLTDIVLPDGTKPRGDGNIERNYIKGRYGAIPYLKTTD